MLLLRLSVCPTDARAWAEFVARYGGTIYQWCCRHHLQDADAQDVTQNVFAALLRGLQTFDRSRARFRSWLYRVVANCVSDWCRAPGHRDEKGTEAARRSLASEEARRDLQACLEEEFDLELLEVAEANVRLQVAPHCWEAYRLRCKERLSLREAAVRLGTPAGHVSKYALRVRDLVARQVTLLEGLAGQRPGRRTEGRHEHLPAAGEMAALRGGPARPGGGPRPDRARPGVLGL
jgi:RNA polymerase sigma-70 factor (ECF subfamily)